ncbi:gamma-glutamylputrescine synthetase [Natrialba swarupiae]|uniref:Glutamine synthetase n=1 Tax=Natrialba swarupiae TaxID=2448032 RepID=A0A5D5AKA1_9EURY|nr:gamma-glutamylputrescine synthetase [Natrialba swarupiae]TYT61604.1 glutamine synthetase [Natrialba swarupiae]
MTDTTDIERTIDANDVELVRLLFVNNSGVPRGRVLDAGDVDAIFEDGANLTKGMQSFNALDALVPDGTFGPVGEIRVVPDPETFRVLPYADRTAVALCNMYELDGTPWDACPRSRLESYLAELTDDGLVPTAAFEGEYYLAREPEEGDGLEPFDDSTCFAVDGMDSAHDVTLDTVDALKAQGLGLSNYYPEYGPGQQELVIEHDEGIAPADNHVLYKATVNAVARQHGLEATFAPQPFDGLPGSGCHVHLSLWRDDENVFADPDGDGPYGLSEFGRQFVAGVLEHAPALVALTAPTVQSYDRLQPGMWASAFTCWGPDNREACVRVPSTNWSDETGSTRIEYKSCDNTANPYLVELGLLAAGMDGVERGLDPGEPLDRDPSALSEDERDARGIERLPETLADALDELAADDVLRDALGETLHESYLEVKRSEWEASVDEDGEWTADYLLRAF